MQKNLKLNIFYTKEIGKNTFSFYIALITFIMVVNNFSQNICLVDRTLHIFCVRNLFHLTS